MVPTARPKAAAAATSEWSISSDGSLHRKLKGFELVINLIEAQQAGNCELIVTADLTTSMTPEQLETNIRPAWVKTRQQLPMTGVRLPPEDLSVAIFRPFSTASQAEAWCDETIEIVADGRSVREVAKTCTRKPLDHITGRAPRVHLVTRPRTGLMGIVLHTSHVMNGHYILIILEEIAKQIVQDDCPRGVGAVFQEEVASELLQKLPISANYAYERAAHIPAPTQEIIDGLASRQAEAARATASRISIGAPVREDWSAHSSRTQDTFTEFSEEALSLLQAAVRRVNVTITAAFWACIILTSLEYSTEDHLGNANGVECLFSTHTSRWFQAPGTAPMTMGVVPTSFWLDLEALKYDRNRSRLDVLIDIAKNVMKAQKDAIDSVHVMKQLDTSAQDLFETTTLRGTKKMPSSEPSVSKPILTSQGDLKLPEWYGDHESSNGRWLRYTDFRYGGRHTDSSICFALSVFRGKLRVQVLFDEKYFELERTKALIEHATDLLRVWIGAEDAVTSERIRDAKL